MADESHVRRVALFALRLVCITPFVLALWWLSMPVYSWGIGQAAALLLKVFGGYPIKGVIISAHGLLNTDTTLGFALDNRTPTTPVSWVVTNVAVFIALVLATRRLTWRQRATALGIGWAILAITHIAHIVVFFAFSKVIARNPQAPTAIAQIFITLPFLLWVVLAYWKGPAAGTNGAANDGPPAPSPPLDAHEKRAHD
ncbi:MAG: hypothetical protein HUU46_12955 [Candidatus Hydrogenedentes bacterium]|nr:hypothetical protein [Candidatus Hydrogenedentota bacterium]